MDKYMTIGILAHVDSGKTTLSEALLYTSGAIRKLGRVDHKDAFLDTYELERSRGITIFSKTASFQYQGTHFDLLDTPGHADFSPEMERTLQVLDMAVLIISAADKVTGQVKVLWKLLKHYNIPVIIFVNKMDQNGADKTAVMEDIRSSLGSCCVDFTDERSAETLEEISVCDDALLTSYLEGNAPTQDDIHSLVTSCRLVPCIFGSALKLEGVKELLDLLSGFTPARDTSSEFGARVYKISRDPGGKRLTHLKITGGTLTVRDQIGSEKVDQIRFYSGEKYETGDHAEAGMICAVTGLSETRPGEGLGVLKDQKISEVLQPILSCAVILPEGESEINAYKLLKTLEEEDPMLQVSFNEAAKHIEMKVMGEVQKEILKHMIKERFGMEVNFGSGHIVYKETIADAVEGVGHYEPLRHYAEVHLLLEPGEPGSGITINSACKTDDLALNWQRLVMTHLLEKKHLGVLTGAEITDIKITLLTGKAHEKHTEGGDFRQATYRAVRQGLMQAHSVLLEPYLDYRIELPQESVGRALSDIQMMNGTVGLPDIEGDKSVLSGTIPAASLGDYAKDLAAYSHGEGHLTTSFSGYRPCHNPEEIIAATGYDPELDTENPSSSVFCSHGAGTLIPWDQVRDYMHLESAYTPNGAGSSTDLTDNIDMEALRKIKESRQKHPDENRSFAEIERDLKAADNELKAIFERTYGAIKPRYTEADSPYDTSSYDSIETSNRDIDIEKEKAAKHQNDSRKEAENKSYILVDGYNIIYASPELASLASRDLKAARDSLIDMLINFNAYRREDVILVYDAYKVPGGREHIEDHHGLSVIYTKEAETADQYIEKAAHEIGKKYRVTVATSDAIEQVIVMSSGAIRMSAREFLSEIESTNERIREHLK